MARWRLRLEDFGRRQEGSSQISEAWHQPRWAAKSKGLKGDEDRPLSSMSTRCPSRTTATVASTPCPSTPRGVLSPTPRLSPTPLGMSPRTPSPTSLPQGLSSPPPPSVRVGGELWAVPRRIEKRRNSEGGKGDLPLTYSLMPETLGVGNLLPSYELWVTLHGGNGKWQQVRAQHHWAQMLVENEEAEVIRKQEAEKQRLRRAEAARQRRAEEEELSRRVEEAEADKKRRKEEEQRLQLQREEEARKARLEEARLLESMKPRKCQKCNGTGRCSNCQGEGSVDVLFLAPQVGKRHMPIVQGRRPRGCRQCGGVGDGSLARDFGPGSGKCDACHGERLIQPPPGGFKTPAKPEPPTAEKPQAKKEDFGSLPDTISMP